MLTTAGFDKWVAKTMLGFSTNPTVILIMIILLMLLHRHHASEFG